ncbi:hypothetical protein DICVIV_12000 [Dictyocaulus viviparus]|uniref:Uncharacterized protein n=1 Tax=Dictyocaulus viviparus TaxID=29172 RepID=A0A0D8XBP8_DICVI|nr:hypothetical protein DICVIV_12000 [Dictyocaulus viviparus]
MRNKRNDDQWTSCTSYYMTPDIKHYKIPLLTHFKRWSPTMRSSHTPIVSMFTIIIFLAVTSNVDAQILRSIRIDGSDLVPYSEIVSELKGRTMEGRMRFGKRSMETLQHDPIYNGESNRRQ